MNKLTCLKDFDRIAKAYTYRLLKKRNGNKFPKFANIAKAADQAMGDNFPAVPIYK